MRNWNIEFIQGDILDKDFINKYFKDADVVHHLAGVTDVPRTFGEANKDQDEKIKKVGELGTQNILDAINNNCKIIFPSTHVVYEALMMSSLILTKMKKQNQYYLTHPLKLINEKQLKTSGKNYIILRLGSVYGYSNDTMRIDIMPNLFSKIASQNGVLRLFAGGKQIKSLVPLIDVARCFKFMEEKDEIKSEVYNLTKDTLSVKEVANICKKYNPKITIKRN